MIRDMIYGFSEIESSFKILLLYQKVGEQMNLELPREPKFYSTEEITMPFTKTMKLQIPSKQKQNYVVREDGIYSSVETYDQDGESMYAEDKMIISKEVFVEAYNAYIKCG